MVAEYDKQRSFTYYINGRKGERLFPAWGTDKNLKIHKSGIDFVTTFECDAFHYEDACFSQFCSELSVGDIAIGPHIIDYLFTINPKLSILCSQGMQRPDAIGLSKVNSHLQLSMLGEFKYKINGDHIRKTHELKGMTDFIYIIKSVTGEFITSLHSQTEGFVPNLDLVIPPLSEIMVIFMSTKEEKITHGTLMEFPYIYRRVKVVFPL
jgi:hypothetical protein